MENGIQNTITLEEIVSALRKAPKILLFCHIRPDGDTVGSAFGLKFALENADPAKQVRILCPHALPERLAFIACGGEMTVPESDADGNLLFPASLDGFSDALKVSIDIAAPGLMGDWFTLSGGVDIKIDHHAMGEAFAARNYVDAGAAACGEIIYRLADILREGGTGELRAWNAIYAAISSDTGNFMYSNTTETTMRTAGELIARGADNAGIAHQLYESRSQSEIRALRLAYSLLHYHANGRIAVIGVTNRDKEENGLSDEDLGALASLPRQIRGVELGIVIRQDEKRPEKFKLSLRSGETVAANEICAAFGGGGHIRAAGAELTASSVEEAEAMILEAALACGVLRRDS